ncbi:sigma-70 family RNA polymerase sigma factor [uncultured Selenomonas sp.]|uniref:sigma-70 family RNA polymerase sigma factor n=1 Tax=uncultured Selenomonas sp. TaxID=159275 RepID=UPI00262B2B60|nr:sigma-70 family RNA polymerase sigma factor [uncultured Selenomonas sp.]
MTINEMVLQSQKGNSEVLAELCEKFQGMFFRAARQRHLRTVFEDALQAARESFLRAVRDFDAALGVPFEGFAKRRVYGDLHTFFRRERAYWQREVHPGDAEEGKSFWESVEDEAASGTASHFALKDALFAAMRTLSEREKELLSLVYLTGWSLKEAAAKTGLSAAYAAVVKRRALQKLKKLLV